MIRYDPWTYDRDSRCCRQLQYPVPRACRARGDAVKSRVSCVIYLAGGEFRRVLDAPQTNELLRRRESLSHIGTIL